MYLPYFLASEECSAQIKTRVQSHRAANSSFAYKIYIFYIYRGRNRTQNAVRGGRGFGMSAHGFEYRSSMHRIYIYIYKLCVVSARNGDAWEKGFYLQLRRRCVSHTLSHTRMHTFTHALDLIHMCRKTHLFPWATQDDVARPKHLTSFGDRTRIPSLWMCAMPCRGHAGFYIKCVFGI